MTNEQMLEAKIIRNNYQQAVKEQNTPLAVALKQNFYTKGFNELMDIDKQEVATNDK